MMVVIFYIMKMRRENKPSEKMFEKNWSFWFWQISGEKKILIRDDIFQESKVNKPEDYTAPESIVEFLADKYLREENPPWKKSYSIGNLISLNRNEKKVILFFGITRTKSSLLWKQMYERKLRKIFNNSASFDGIPLETLIPILLQSLIMPLNLLWSESVGSFKSCRIICFIFRYLP